MLRTRTLAAGIAVVTALGVVSAATAAPSASKPRAAQVVKLKKADKQFGAIVKRVNTCTAAKPVVASAKKVRTAAMKNHRTASVKVLRAKNARMAAAVLKLAKVASKCGVAVPAVPGGPVVVTPGSGGLTTTPVNGAPGAPGQNGAPGQPGAPGGNGATSITLELPLITLLDGLPINLSAVLNGGVLPQVIQLVPASSLTSPLCSAVGTACVGINPANLSQVLSQVTAGIPLVGGLLTTITSSLTGGNLSSLFTVQRVSDTVVKIVPTGPLATVRALLGSLAGAPTTTVGILKTVR